MTTAALRRSGCHPEGAHDPREKHTESETTSVRKTRQCSGEINNKSTQQQQRGTTNITNQAQSKQNAAKMPQQEHAKQTAQELYATYQPEEMSKKKRRNTTGSK